jgi:hypothetical protein
VEVVIEDAGIQGVTLTKTGKGCMVTGPSSALARLQQGIDIQMRIGKEHSALQAKIDALEREEWGPGLEWAKFVAAHRRRKAA